MSQLIATDFIVVCKDRARYAANHLMTSIRQPNWESVISFISSGNLITLPATDVDHIELAQLTYCFNCDQPLPDNCYIEGVD